MFNAVDRSNSKQLQRTTVHDHYIVTARSEIHIKVKPIAFRNSRHLTFNHILIEFDYDITTKSINVGISKQTNIT